MPLFTLPGNGGILVLWTHFSLLFFLLLFEDKKSLPYCKISLEFWIALFGKGSFGELPGLQQIIIVLIPS